MCDLNNPEQVKVILATVQWKLSTRKAMSDIYTGYLKYIGKTWDKPQYQVQTEIPFIPTEQELGCLTASASRAKTATLLQLLKGTGGRIGEIAHLKWTQIDTERKTVSIKAEKTATAESFQSATNSLTCLTTSRDPTKRSSKPESTDCAGLLSHYATKQPRN